MFLTRTQRRRNDPRGRPGRRMTASHVGGPLVVLALAISAVWSFARPDVPTESAAGSPADDVATLERRTVERPNDPGAWRALALAYAALAHSAADPTYYDRSAKAFDEAERLDPGAPATAVARATVQAVLHQFAEADRLATHALNVNPLDPDALVVFVDANVELGRYTEATDALQRLLDHKPSMAALSRASYLRELHGDLAGALEALRQGEIAGQHAPSADRAQAIRIRGDVLFAHGDLDGARAVYEDILRLEPGYPDARIGLARVTAASGDRPAAVRDLQQLLDEVNDPHAWIALADIASGVDDDLARSAIETSRRLLFQDEANGASIDLDLALFDTDHRSAPPAETVARAERAYRKQPSVHGADTLAWALVRAGRVTEAMPLIDEALRLGSLDARIHYHAAVIHAATGQPDLARRHLQRTIETNPFFSFSQIPDARRLAFALELIPPAAWASFG